MTAGAPQVTKEGTKVPVSVSIPIGNLLLLPGGPRHKGAFSVFVAWAGAAGEFSEVVRQRRDLVIPEADLARALAGSVRFDLDVRTEGPNVRLSVGVWDETGGEAGFALLGAPRG